MSCDHELANEWARCGGKNASYITNALIDCGVGGPDGKIFLARGPYFLNERKIFFVRPGPTQHFIKCLLSIGNFKNSV